jgi:hypothetical protein
MANIVFDKATQKVIKDAVKHAYLVLLTVLKHLLYLMTNYYLITIFVVLLTSVSHGVKTLLYPILVGATAYLARWYQKGCWEMHATGAAHVPRKCFVGF